MSRRPPPAENVAAVVEIVVVPHCFAFENLPDALCMPILLIADVLVRKLAEEGFLGGIFGLGKALPGVHVLVWVDALAHKQFAPLFGRLLPRRDPKRFRPV